MDKNNNGKNELKEYLIEHEEIKGLEDEEVAVEEKKVV